jgi:long-subunit fatty acid transport protein
LWGAWDSFLIDTIAGKETSYRSMMEKVDMKHSSKVERRGGVDEMVFSFGANYDDILFLGATVGLPFINFTENRTFVEENDRYRNDYLFQYYKMKDKLNVRSTGINLKLGALYQPVDFMRVGFAFHTPTYYGNVKDNFERRVEIAFDSYESYANRFNYTLTTPLRVMANVAFFIKKRAFVSAEYELVDYSMANLSSMDYDFNDLDGENENQTIRDLYGLSHTLRIGAEVNLNEVFAIRAGYNYISSPYKDGYSREYNGLKFSGAKHYASFGFGFRTRVFYSDFAYAITTSKDLYWMYNPQYVNAVGNKFITHKVMLTMGIRF